MSIATMLSQLSELSPQARYALMKLWLDNKDALPLQLSVHDCARHMAIPRARAGRILNELIEADYLEFHHVPSEKGRPKRVFDIPTKSANLLRALTPNHLDDQLHLESIHALLSHRTSALVSVTADLSPSNLVFLIALLSRANECGAVRGLGKAKLITYTGMSSQRINLQINKMRKLGILLSTVPGVTSGRILGRTTTTYWLNLSHKFLGVKNPQLVVKKGLATLQSGDIANELFELVRQLNLEKIKHQKKYGTHLSSQKALALASVELSAHRIEKISDLDISLLEDFFREPQNPGLRSAFQSVLDQVARDNALARIHAKLSEGKIILTTNMLRRLYRELLPIRFHKTNSTDLPSRKSKQMLIRLTLRLVDIMADEIINIIPEFGWDISQITSLELAPHYRKPATDRHLIVTLCPPDSEQHAKLQNSTGDNGRLS